MGDIHKVKIVLDMSGGGAEKHVLMPIMPTGTVIHCIPEYEEYLEISHWVIVPSQGGSVMEIDCHVDCRDWGLEDLTGRDEETIEDWLKRVGFVVWSSRRK